MTAIRSKLSTHSDLNKVKKEERLVMERWKKERLQSIRLLSDSTMSYREVSEIVGKSAKQIKVWAKKYIEGGVESLLERGNGGGCKGKMTKEAQEDLVEQLRVGRFRTAKQCCKWLKEAHQIELKESSMYYQLGKLGGRLKVPRPSHTKKDKAKEEEFRVTLADKLHNLNLPKNTPIRLWVYDEMRYGLHPLVRKMWSLVGHRVVAPVHRRFDWGYLFGAMEVSRGKGEFLHTGRISKDFDRAFLEQISKSESGAMHVVIGDGAGFHHREGIKQENPLPDNLRIITLPAYCPELNPAEKLWDVIKDRICTTCWENLDAVAEKIDEVLEEHWTRSGKFRSYFTNSYLRLELNVI